MAARWPLVTRRSAAARFGAADYAWRRGLACAPPPRRRGAAPTTTAGAAPWELASAGAETESPSLTMRADLRIVLYRPQIPQNAGNVARSCAATGVPLDLVAPLGFRIDDAKLKRAGLDYWHSVCARVYGDGGGGRGGEEEEAAKNTKGEGASGGDANGGGDAKDEGKDGSGEDGWPALLRAYDRSPSPKRLVAFTVYGATHYAGPAFRYRPGDWLLFGSETEGLPPSAHADVLARRGALVKIPMRGGARSPVRSLNLATSVGVGMYEALRQLDLEEGGGSGQAAAVEPRDDALWRETPMQRSARLRGGGGG